MLRAACLAGCCRVAGLCLLMFFLASFASISVLSESVAAAYSIELGEFRWKRFPLRVFVDMNQWSVSSYSVAVRGAVESWIESIWNYTYSFGDPSLMMVNYVFYLSGVNSSGGYDVVVSFCQDEISPSSRIVGWTTCKWDIATHEPISPISISIATYSGTADDLFVRCVAAHEFGHALGLGHASSERALNGPELMYYASVKDQVVCPSTLDVYGLAVLYGGSFGKAVQLPLEMPYSMLAGGNVSRVPVAFLWEVYKKYVLVVVAFLFVLVVFVVLWKNVRLSAERDSVSDSGV